MLQCPPLTLPQKTTYTAELECGTALQEILSKLHIEREHPALPDLQVGHGQFDRDLPRVSHTQTMQANDHQPNDPSEPTGAGENPDQNERTRSGQIVQDLARVTRPMAALAERRPASQAATAAMRERVSALL